MATIPEIEAHPAALLFPLMGEEELGKLADDIAANGLLEPVVLYHGQILDGRNRLAACQLADVEPRFVEVDGDLPSPTIYVLSKNLHRRHLTSSQMAAIGADAVPILKDEAHHRQVSHLKQNQQVAPLAPTDANGRCSEIVGNALGVGRRNIERALQVKREAPEVFEQVKRGEVTVRSAARNLETARKDAPVYEPKTDHQKKLAEGQKERMVRALSMMSGLCRGLLEMDIRKAVSVCNEEERAIWIERSKELSSQLRTFAGKLQKGF